MGFLLSRKWLSAIKESQQLKLKTEIGIPALCSVEAFDPSWSGMLGYCPSQTGPVIARRHLDLILPGLFTDPFRTGTDPGL